MDDFRGADYPVLGGEAFMISEVLRDFELDWEIATETGGSILDCETFPFKHRSFDFAINIEFHTHFVKTQNSDR